MKSKKYIWMYVVAFMIPWLVTIVHSVICNVWPLGEGFILLGDMKEQYVQLYYELWDKVHNGESLFYSWNAMGGYDFLANFFYYLCSPFSLIVILLPRDYIVYSLQFIMILKWSLVPVTMLYYFLHTRHNVLTRNKELVSFFLAIAFALSNGMIYFVSYPNWLDAMILFPILLLLLEYMIQTEKWKLYVVVLSVMIICNYYITFHICLFLIFWFFFNIDKNTVNKVKKFLTFAGGSIVAACISGICLLPGVFMGMNRFSEDASINKLGFMRSFRMSLSEFFDGFLCLQPMGAVIDEHPNIYFSIIGIVLIFLFPFIKMEKRKKWYLISLLLFMSASFLVGVLNLLWHGFMVPNGVFNRFVNVYVFLLLFIIMHVLKGLQDVRLRHIAVVGCVEVLAVVWILFSSSELHEFYVYLATIMLIVLYALLLVFHRKGSISYDKIIIVLCIFGMIELSVNAVLVFRKTACENFLEEKSYVCYEKLTEDIELEKGERISGNIGNFNIGMMFNKAFSSGFLSVGDSNIRHLYQRFGLMKSTEVIAAYGGGSPLLNLIFNIAYNVGETDVAVSDAEVVESYDGYNTYKMKRLAGLGYMVDESIKDWNVEEGYPFDVQNEFLKYAVDGEPIFEVIYPEVQGSTLEGTIEPMEELIEDGVYAYQYDAVYGARNDAMQMEFVVDEDMDLYSIIYQPHAMYVYVYIDGELMYGATSAISQQTLHIGEVKKAQTVTIIFVPTDGITIGDLVECHCQFAKYNDESYAKSYEKLSEQLFKIDVMESDYVKGTIDVEKEGIMMTSIPATSGFTVLVDGKEKEYEAIGNAMIGVPLKTGKHTIEFVYKTPYYEKGKVMSIIGVLLFFALIGKGRINRKKYVKAS